MLAKSLVAKTDTAINTRPPCQWPSSGQQQPSLIEQTDHLYQLSFPRQCTTSIWMYCTEVLRRKHRPRRIRTNRACYWDITAKGEWIRRSNPPSFAMEFLQESDNLLPLLLLLFSSLHSSGPDEGAKYVGFGGAEILAITEAADRSLHLRDRLTAILQNSHSFPTRLSVDSYRLCSTITTLNYGREYLLRPTVALLCDSCEGKEIYIIEWTLGKVKIADALSKNNLDTSSFLLRCFIWIITSLTVILL